MNANHQQVAKLDQFYWKFDGMNSDMNEIDKKVSDLNTVQAEDRTEIARLKEQNDRLLSGGSRGDNSVTFAKPPSTPFANGSDLRRQSFFFNNRRQESHEGSDGQNTQGQQVGITPNRARTTDPETAAFLGGTQTQHAEKLANRDNLSISIPLNQKRHDLRDVVSVRSVFAARDMKSEDGRDSFGIGERNLDEYFSNKAIKQLVLNDQKMKVAFSNLLDAHNWTSIDDGMFLDMCGRYIRSLKPTKEGFLEIFVDGLGKFEFAVDNHWSVGVRGWSKYVEGPLAEIIMRGKHVQILMMRGLQHGELIPPETYQGSGQEPGLINAFLTVLKPLKDNIKTYFGGDKQLKVFKTLQDFLDKLELMNKAMASQDVEYIKITSTLVPFTPIEDLVQKVQDKNRQQDRTSQQVRQVKYDQRKQEIGRQLAEGRLQRQEAVDESVDTEDDRRDSLYASIYPLETLDDSFSELPKDSTSALKTFPQEVLRTAIDEHQREQQNNCHDEDARLEYASREKTPLTPAEKREYVCYKVVYGGKCEDLGCAYRHDVEKCW
jgi:hypothetical protein